jgi:alkanesulfonate monooxygenase SsuD/methylene tetrahydromethanopterin reductase-like flavin-dependent oxidoreductase (luciferase family)
VLVDIGIGLPATNPGVQREELLAWARRAEERGFSSLGTIDRLVYPNLESLVVLAAAAAVTERIRLATDILLAPLRGNGALLAKQAATIDALSGGRLTLGVAPGARPDDYEAADVSFERRGRLMDYLLDEIRQVWAGEERGVAGAIGPPPAREGGPELLIGGTIDASFRRVARFGDGWAFGGGTPDQFEEMAGKVRRAWSDAGREGSPRLVALCYFALGEGAREAAERYIHHYYAYLGDEIADQIAQSAAVDEEVARQYRDAFASAGADELVYFPCSTDPGQVDLLAEAVR